MWILQIKYPESKFVFMLVWQVLSFLNALNSSVVSAVTACNCQNDGQYDLFFFPPDICLFSEENICDSVASPTSLSCHAVHILWGPY